MFTVLMYGNAVYEYQQSLMLLQAAIFICIFPDVRMYRPISKQNSVHKIKIKLKKLLN